MRAKGKGECSDTGFLE